MQPLTHSITGHIREQESGLGVANLLVRAYDKDLLFDDLLGTSITDANGYFALRYSEQDFNELLDRRPDIYLLVYGSARRVLLDTREAVRPNASAAETFDLTIPRAQLGPLSPVQPPDRVVGHVGLADDALTIEQRGGFAIPRLPRFQLAGAPGTPALPHQTRYVMLPLGGTVLSVHVTPGEPVWLDGPFNPLPAQEPIPDRGLDPRTQQPLPPTVPFRTLDERQTAHLAQDPQAMVRVGRTRVMGMVQLVALDVCPVQYDLAQRTYRYYPELRYEIVFDRAAADRKTDEFRQSARSIGEWKLEAIEGWMLNPDLQIGPGIFYGVPPVLEKTPHLIISDNVAWPSAINNPNGTTRPPKPTDPATPLDGDLLAEFARLADWRTQQGMRSKVVSITDILYGTYGDCTQGGFAVDLHEVIRNFLKMAHADWGTSYVVLGGDVNVVPMRHMTAPLNWDYNGILPVDTNPPNEREGYHAPGTTVAKLHAGFDPAFDTPLCRYSDGKRIPYNRDASANTPGWYFTTEADFTDKDSDFTRQPDHQPTRFVILEGPANTLVGQSYYWVAEVNSIPSDFYYASLTQGQYGAAGKHDFDYNGNGLYGQYVYDGTKEVTLDGAEPDAAIWVGRVPAESGAEVRGYVNKLITYESLKTPGHAPQKVDATYLKTVLYAADHWFAQGISRQDDLTKPPAEGTFTHKEWAWVTYLHLNFDVNLVGNATDWTLYRIKDSVRAELSYTAPSANGFWAFMTDDTYADTSDGPTRFVKVYGNGTSNDADSFLWLPTALDLAMQQKETLRLQLNDRYPNFKDSHRYYADVYDLTPPPPLTQLTEETLRVALSKGPHLVSLTGHGWWGGCCTINVAANPDFTNKNQYFVAFADSCSTAKPDGVDSLGEKSVLDPDGGAVAYVGNTRYGWVNYGAGYEQAFWELLNLTIDDGKNTTPASTAGQLKKRLNRGLPIGMAAGLRMSTGPELLWTNYAQTLYGDPALSVWVGIPGEKPSYTYWTDPTDREFVAIGVVHPGDPVMGLFERGDTIPNARVTLTTEDGTLIDTGRTNDFGQVRLSLRHYADRRPLRLTIRTRTNQLLTEWLDLEAGSGKP